ncbi:PKD domain-containing protein [Flavobacterium humi]|uniref:PKD domain-containing protein n=1 Tax=Flavobacterium humi TaxID=2562683 RepID=A0A4Z0L943_9FLAO|nr:hypothetical protein [Flavobacterium humi]TGD57503.1 hypothetical protein E4635_09930 [Flavobacterium humi]
MEAYNTSIYPVFEADQVLSQKELNLVVSHLEEQDRITRKNLTGLGIVCGLELSFPSENIVKIACGTAVTSLGFQINWKEQTLSHYHDFEISDQFLHPDYIREPYLDNIFKYASAYQPIKNCAELLPADSNLVDKKPIPSGFFNDKAIILLLEVTLIDQKNCVTTNCDDKGKRMEFNIRPLVIPINESTKGLLKEYQQPELYSKLTFPRYNVPFQNITTGTQVLDAFKKVYDPAQVNTISNAIDNVYEDHKEALAPHGNLAVLDNSKAKIDEMVNIHKASVNIQYVWDWISDIVEAYNEIIAFKKLYPTLCCINENLFPFHVVLGGNSAYANTFRTPFIQTLSATKKEEKKVQKLTLLFERLAHILNSFEVEKNIKIKVTPSSYGNLPLSEKAIPYYYNSVLDLNKKWNPELTVKGKNDTILSYRSDMLNYTNKLSVQKPLLFDIEPYNFFRIEGHLGMNYKKAIKDLNLIKDSYSLPFKITALNAVDYLNKEVDILKFDGRWDDLETDYDLARKRVYNITEFVIKWMDLRRTVLADNNIISTQNIDNFKNILAQLKNLLTNDLKEFLPNYKSFYEIFKQLNYVFLFHRWCIQLFNPSLSTIAEDLIDRFDDINELFLDDPFTVIYEEANIRWQKAYKDLFFSTFLKKHPGLEHKGGVTKGGTFVLVYVDTSIFKAVAPPLFHANLLSAVTAYKDNIPIATSIKDDLIKSVKFTDYKSQIKRKPALNAANKCKDEADNIKNDLLELAMYNMDAHYTAEMSGYILENLKDVLQFEVSAAPQVPFQQMIIADFFLPYLCCGDGNTIEVKIEVKEPLSISLDPLKFCNNDVEGEYEIIIKGKSGGTFTGTGKDAITQSGDKYYLHPHHASIQTPKIYTLQYEVEEELSNTVEFEISTPATLKWRALIDATMPTKINFTNLVAGDSHEYEINFGDGSDKVTTHEANISHMYPASEGNMSYTASIQQLGEVCQSMQVIVVEVLGSSNPHDFNAPDFNSSDFSTK